MSGNGRRGVCAFRAFTHLTPNVEHKSEVTRPLPLPTSPPIKFQIVFSPPVGAALGSLLNAVSSCTCESHFLLFLKLALRIAFRLRSLDAFYIARDYVLQTKVRIRFLSSIVGVKRHACDAGIGKCESIRRLSVDNYSVGSRSYINNYRASATNGKQASCACKRGTAILHEL